MLTKIMSGAKSDWELKLHSTIWAYWVAYKTLIETTPFNMVYGLDAIIPMDY